MEGERGATNNGITGSIDLQTAGESPVVDLTDQIHQLPCCIKYNGPCSVSDYFKPKKTGVEYEGLTHEEAYFRGRKLEGANISLPDGYRGFILGKKKPTGKRKAKQTSEDNTNNWETRASFESVTYWNHDSVPSNNDAFVRCFHWFQVANALHKPVTAEDLARTSTLPG